MNSKVHWTWVNWPKSLNEHSNCLTWEKQNRIQTPCSSKIIPTCGLEASWASRDCLSSHQNHQCISHSHIFNLQKLPANRLFLTEISRGRFCVRNNLPLHFWINLQFLYNAFWFFSYEREWTISPICLFHSKISKPSPSSSHSATSLPALFPCTKLFSHSILFFKFKAICSVISSFSLNLKLLSPAWQRMVWNLTSHWQEEKICSYSISTEHLPSLKRKNFEQRW